MTGIDTHGRHLDEIQQQTASRLTSTAIYPTPSFDLEVVEKSGKTVLVLRVLPYPVPPVVAVSAVAWVRKGTTTVRATDADLSRLREPGRTPRDCSTPAASPKLRWMIWN